MVAGGGMVEWTGALVVLAVAVEQSRALPARHCTSGSGADARSAPSHLVAPSTPSRLPQPTLAHVESEHVRVSLESRRVRV